MERMGYRNRFLAGSLLALLLWSPILATAQSIDQNANDPADTGLKQEIDSLNAQVKDKESRIKDLSSTIKNYETKINDQQNAVTSLQNQLALLDNRIQDKQLGIQRTIQQVELANLEIQSLVNQIQLEQNTINRREISLSELVQQIEQADRVSEMDAFIARPSLSEFFSHLDELKRVETELADATRSVKESKVLAEKKKKDLEDRRLALQDEKQQLQKEQRDLEFDRSAKTSLVAETQNQEDEFQRVIYELRQQQQSEGDGISALQDRLKDKLNSIDEALARGDILLSLPIAPKKGISAKFHDPTYPFRKFFEHPGIDLPTDVGTPVHAAAGGYVAWLKTGKQYGNYIMIVHPGGVATVYAHLSRFGIKADTYVERGAVIGYSGGMPGMQGAGLSTGPHLHFEVRLNGIPINPENYLPSFD